MKFLARQFLIILCFIFVGGCKKEAIHTYRIPKEKERPVVAGMTASSSKSNPEIQWVVPVGWMEQPLSSMRAGSFLAKAKNGYEADISVVSFSGEAGGALPNVNRWRDQIGLAAISEQELPRVSEKISVPAGPMLMFDFVSRDNIVDQKFKKRIVAVICHRPDKTWFFKMIGEEQVVGEMEPSFRRFLSSLKFQK